jgi:hypothetical protein
MTNKEKAIKTYKKPPAYNKCRDCVHVFSIWNFSVCDIMCQRVNPEGMCDMFVCKSKTDKG